MNEDTDESPSGSFLSREADAESLIVAREVVEIGHPFAPWRKVNNSSSMWQFHSLVQAIITIEGKLDQGAQGSVYVGTAQYTEGPLKHSKARLSSSPSSARWFVHPNYQGYFLSCRLFSLESHLLQVANPTPDSINSDDFGAYESLSDYSVHLAGWRAVRAKGDPELLAMLSTPFASIRYGSYKVSFSILHICLDLAPCHSTC